MTGGILRTIAVSRPESVSDVKIGIIRLRPECSILGSGSLTKWRKSLYLPPLRGGQGGLMPSKFGHVDATITDIEKRPSTVGALRGHLELLLSKRPDLISEFNLRP